jgi:hypothetical protein
VEWGFHMGSADITGGTYFAIAWAAGFIGLLAWMYRSPGDSRRQVYATLIVASFALGIGVAALILVVGPTGPNAPDGPSGWTVGHVKWIPVLLATFVALMMFVVEVIQRSLGEHIGHLHTGCQSSGCTSRPHGHRDLSGLVRRHTVLVVALGVLLVGGLLAFGTCQMGLGCVYDFRYLPALRADPIASYTPPGTELTMTAEEGGWVGLVTGGSFERVFDILDHDSVEAVVEDAVAEAISEGWVFGTSGVGCKELGPGIAQLVVTSVKPLEPMPMRDRDGTFHPAPTDATGPESFRLSILLRYAPEIVTPCA